MMRSVYIWMIALFFAVLAMPSCTESQDVVADQHAMGYPITPVDIRQVKINDHFWLPVIQRVQEQTIDYAIAKCEEEGRFDNFLMAGGEMEGTVKGEMPFDDTDVYKIIEGASNSLISAPNPELEGLLDSLIQIIAIGQEADGYLTTWRTINPAQPPAPWVEVKEGKRWESLFMSHELYNAGHLYEAAAVHYRATGKRNFLDIALKNADLMVATFGPDDTQLHAVPGHQIIETGLIKLYQITGKEDYLDLARYFLDNRGNPDNHPLFGPYSQDHIPVVDQEEVVGHAVRAMYMYAAMTDIAALENDSAYLSAVHKLWDNMVDKKLYITGGIGARHDGEAFGENYELPNLTAYNETCASIGQVYWDHRLFDLTGNAQYMDLLERTLYNGLISGLSLDGTHFFYPNALESDGEHTFNRGSCTRADWFDCSCCPTNIIRFVPSIPGLLYSTIGDTLYVNLYASGTSEIDLQDLSMTLEQETNYPWDGDIRIKVTPGSLSRASIKLRIPGWARNEVAWGDLYHFTETAGAEPLLSVNGEVMDIDLQKGYATITRQWQEGDVILLQLPMPVRFVEANSLVTDDRGKVAIQRGPVVYALEGIDNPAGFDNITIDNATELAPVYEADLLGGVVTLNNEQMKAIPYYAWSNRGPGKMKVWVDYKNE